MPGAVEASYAAAAVAGLLAVAAGSVGVVAARRTIHVISWLVVAALGVAVVLALLGYSYIAVFHVVIYLGTAITLLAIIVMLFGDLGEPRPFSPLRGLLAVFAAAALQAPLLLYSLRVEHPRGTGAAIQEAARLLLDCWLCTLLIVVAIATVLIEAVAVARGEAGRASR